MKAPAGLRKERHKHAQQQAQHRHPNKAGPIRDVAAPRTAHAPAIYLLFHHLSEALSLSSVCVTLSLSQACLFVKETDNS
jgi:hypothetical protein